VPAVRGSASQRPVSHGAKIDEILGTPRIIAREHLQHDASAETVSAFQAVTYFAASPRAGIVAEL